MPSCHIEPSRTVERGQLGTRPERPPFLQMGHDAPRGVRRCFANRVHHEFLEILDDLEIDQGAGNGQWQAEPLSDFARQFEDDVRQGTAIGALLAGLRHRPHEFVVDDVAQPVGTAPPACEGPSTFPERASWRYFTKTTSLRFSL